MGDAFAEGVNPGGLYSAQEIKILICYLLLTVGEPMPESAVVEVLYGGEMANFFEVSAAIQELLKLGHLKEEDDLLSITETGKQIGGTLATMVPFTLRERSLSAALRLMARRHRQNSTDAQIQKEEAGCVVTCRIRDAETPLMELSLRVGDEMQARLVRERFLDDPTLLYRTIIAALTGGAHTERDDRRLIVDFR